MAGGGTTEVQNNTPPQTPEEKALVTLNTQLAQKQLDAINQQSPFTQQLLQSASQSLAQQDAINSAINAAITPQQQAQAALDQFNQAQTLGPIQTQLAQLQLDQLKNGGKATPDQLKTIADATDAGIASGTQDINTQTQRGIGLISDELANSRGLRLSDSPLTGEAALLTRAGNDQIASLTTNLRAGQAQAALNYPLAVQQLQSGVNQNQQQLNTNVQQFQQQLQQQAYQNRLALSGLSSSNGIGLASVGNGVGASTLNGLTQARVGSGSQTTTSNPSLGLSSLSGLGSLASGLGSLAAFSDRRLKSEIKRIRTTLNGLNVYSYKILGKSQIGVMADEVEKIIPEAVSLHWTGYKQVNYGMLNGLL